jgi:GNAT superfamily N-acetyltransferase
VEERNQPETKALTIADYEPKYQGAFRKLNEEWISTYFEMEEADRKALEHPQEYILDRGGYIFVAVLDGEPVGVCSLLKRDDLDAYELAKMAVSPKAQGKRIGYLLGQAAIDKARSLNASRIYLESNTQLVPAIRLYQKLGFKRIVGPPTPYQRCDIQMELELIPGARS